MGKVKIALVGAGNCASALVQGISHYGRNDETRSIGLMHEQIGGYRPSDIEVVCAFDIDRRKVGIDLRWALQAPPNCTRRFCETAEPVGVEVQMGPVLDGVAPHTRAYPEKERIVPADHPEPTAAQVVETLEKSGAHMLINYLPVGSQKATEFYARCALEAGVGLVNCIPVFIASDADWAARFAERGLPLVGDDIKSQLGATIVHRVLTDLFKKRGVKLDRTYQLNVAGNTDFLNMLDRSRLASKRISKTEAVQSVAGEPLSAENMHICPSDYVPWQKDNKVCFIRIEGRLFGGVPMNLELRLSVEDSANSAGIVIDALRCCKLALDRGQGGVLTAPSAFFMKHPPEQFSDDEAYTLVENFIARQAGSVETD